MRTLLTAGLMLGLAACAGAPVSLEEAAAAHDWQNEDGPLLQRAFNKDVKAFARGKGRAEVLNAVKVSNYECTYGEGHQDYPEPAAVCTRSFATRACQMNWEISLTSDPKKPNSIDAVDGAFTRDCVGVDRDFPEAKRSAIDDQLAPPTLPEPN